MWTINVLSRRKYFRGSRKNITDPTIVKTPSVIIGRVNKVWLDQRKPWKAFGSD